VSAARPLRAHQSLTFSARNCNGRDARPESRGWVGGGTKEDEMKILLKIVPISMPEPKRHHYLPEFYLRGFARDEKFCVFDRKRGQYRTQTPKNTGVEKDFYQFLDKEGLPTNILETDLSKIEGEAKSIIRRLEAGEVIEPEERVYLAFFIAFLFSRTPKFEREMNQVEDGVIKATLKHMFPTVDRVEAYLDSLPRESRTSAKSFFDFVHDEKLSVTNPRTNVIKAMLEMTPEIAHTFMLMDWAVLHADERTAFVTTDSPFGLCIPDDVRGTGRPVGAGSTDIVKAVPLSSSVCLLLGGFGLGFGHFSADRRRVRELNVIIASECEHYLIGRDEQLVRTVVTRSKIDVAQPATRLRVDHIPHPTDPTRTFMMTRRVVADAPDDPPQVIVDDTGGHSSD
jgi:hypothetical protein